MTLNNLPDIVTPKQLADYLQVSEMTIKRALKSNRLIGFKVSRDWRIEKIEIIKWLTNKGD
jgi:excisionase family DNA binding protein